MNKELFDIRKHRWWGAIPLVMLVWHGIYTAIVFSPGYLLFVCYAANLLLGVGILIRSRLLVATGFGWAFIGLPFWLHYVIRTSDWDISGALLHLCGALVGCLSLRYYRYPKHTWAFSLAFAALLQTLSRWWTAETLNVNAAFRVYEGWEHIFSNYTIYTITMAFGFGLFFIVLTMINRRTCRQRTQSSGNQKVGTRFIASGRITLPVKKSK